MEFGQTDHNWSHQYPSPLITNKYTLGTNLSFSLAGSSHFRKTTSSDREYLASLTGYC